MTLREEIEQGENVALEFKEARPTVVAFANGHGWRTVPDTSHQFEWWYNSKGGGR